MTVNDGTTRVKGPTLRYREEVDAALILALMVIGYGAQNSYRIQWKTAMSNGVPVVRVGSTHLHGEPQLHHAPA